VAVKRLHEPVSRLRSELVLGSSRESINHETTNGQPRQMMPSGSSDLLGCNHSLESTASTESGGQNCSVLRVSLGIGSLSKGSTLQRSTRTWSNYIRCVLLSWFGYGYQFQYEYVVRFCTHCLVNQRVKLRFPDTHSIIIVHDLFYCTK
jgi:hypothetical protein